MLTYLLLNIFPGARSTSCSKTEYEAVSSTYPFQLMTLPYEESYLEPFVSEDIVYAHYEHHHQGYVDKLNAFLEANTEYQSYTLVELNYLAENVEMLGRFGGGIYNHDLYWYVLTNPGCTKEGPEGVLAEKITNQFGSVDEFLTKFNSALGSIFGSGWAWACVNQTASIEIRTTRNQINPLMNVDDTGICYPFLGCDAWEHAYYLQYSWNKQEYYDAFFDAIDWDVVEMFYESYASNLEAVPF
jgi:Fe-Mn family superoxide dismutase